MGIVSGPAGASALLVDGRQVLLSKKTDYSCAAKPAAFAVRNGIPDFPKGTSVDVFGKWDKKAEAYEATSVCLQAVPNKQVSGAGFIDAVKPGPGGSTLVYADGRTLLLLNAGSPGGAAQPIVKQTSPLHTGDPLVAGEWLEYHAEREKDGSLQITEAIAHQRLKTRLNDALRSFKPATFVIPSAGAPGKLKAERLAPTFNLPDDPANLDRLATLGETLIPPWQKQLPPDDPEKIDFRFYEAEKLPVEDCVSFPNGIILVSKKTLSILTEDSDLAGLLAGCVAEVTEAQAARYLPKLAANSGISAGAAIAGAFVPGVGLLALGNAAYSSHEQHAAEEAAARVAVDYLTLAGYSPNSNASAWEKLEGKHGQMAPDKEPGTRSRLAYQAEAEALP